LDLYLAKSGNTINPSASDVKRIGRVTRGGEQSFESVGGAAGFSHVVLFCAGARVNFGSAVFSAANTFSTVKMGSLVQAQGSPGMTSGSVSLLRNGSLEVVRFASGFETFLQTGTVEIYLARSAINIKDQPVANRVKIGDIRANGMQDILLPSASTGFDFIVLYCAGAQINFGAAQLQ
jgi:hypothetical protein